MNRRPDCGQSRGAGWRGLACLALLGGLIIAPSSVLAQFHVVPPDTVEGETTVGDRAAAYVGPGADEKLRQGHEAEFTYDFTDRIGLVAQGLFQQPIDEPLEAKNYHLGAQASFIQRHGDGLGLGARLLYQFAAESGSPDALFYGPMARFVWDHNSAMANAFFISEVGEDASSTQLKLSWQLRHDLGPKLGLGVEGYTDIKDITDPGSFEDQLHRLGPVLYLDLHSRDPKEILRPDLEPHPEPPSVRIIAGVLLGLTEATSDVTFKLDVSAAFY